ncbi:MAG: class I SAM-dependent methyltransferase [Acidimicrobiia bacterium]
MEETTPDPDFMLEAKALEMAYLGSDDPILQSGFHGGRERWVAERSPLIDAIHRDGTFLDVGCANGLLAADVVDWAAERGYRIEPFGIDLGRRLVALARQRLPEHAVNFVAADAWTWAPDRRWTFVYSLLDLGPMDLWCQWLRRLHGWVEPDGRLIVGSYGSRSRGEDPMDVRRVLEDCGIEVAGSSVGGEGPIARFTWANKS